MTRKKEGAKRIHLNIEVTDTQFKLFRSLGDPKEAFMELLDTRMSSEQKYRHAIELKQEEIRKAQQDLVVLQTMAQAAQQAEVVVQASPEIEEKRIKLTANLIEKPFDDWTQSNRSGMIETKLWVNVAELKAWIKRKQNGDDHPTCGVTVHKAHGAAIPL